MASFGESVLGLAGLVSEDPFNGLMLWLALAAIAAAFVAFIALHRVRRNAHRLASADENRIDELEKELAEVKSFASAMPAINIIWRGEKDDKPRISGGLPGCDGVPDGKMEVADFEVWLEPGSFIRLDEALEKLKSWGTPFNLFLKTRAGASLEADGRAIAGNVALRLRDLAGKMLKFSELTETCDELEKESSSLRSLLDAASQPAWLRNRQDNVIWVNQAYSEAVEAKSPEDAVEGSVELIAAGERENVDEALKAHGKIHALIKAVVKGERKSLDVTVTEAACGSAGMAVDRSKTDELKDEIKRHIKAHERTLDQLEAAVAIFGADQKLRYFNSACLDLWRLEDDWLRTKPGNGEIFDRLRVSERLPQEVDYRVWKDGQLGIYASVEPREDWWHLKDGQVLRVVSEPHPFGGVIWLMEDVTEKHELDRRYRTSLTVQRETLDHLREGVAMFGSNGRLQLFNPAFAQMWKLDAGHLKTTPHIEQVAEWCEPLYDGNEVWDEIRSDITALGHERPARDWRMERNDGQVLDAFFVPLPEGAGLLAFVDETDSWRAERALVERNEALIAADKIKNAFVSNASYKLREPLTSIKGFTELLADGTFGELNKKQSEYIGDIGEASETLDNVITDILDLAIMDAGVMELDLTQVDVGAVMEAAAEMVSKPLQKFSLKLELTIPKSLGSIIADERRLKQVLFNLLFSAIEFSPKKSTIKMEAKREGEFINLWVNDQGGGIDPGLPGKVFDRFDPDSKNTGHRGAGLGLAIVKGFVELHGGKAELGAREGKGATVTCRFPVKGPGAEDEAAE